MIATTLGELARELGGTLLRGTSADAEITGQVVIDSRLAAGGGLFGCFVGERADGHDFARAAVESGAVGVVASRSVDAPGILVQDVALALAAIARWVLRGSGATTIGVTGSSGKTSTKDLLAAVFSAAAATVAPPGSFNNELGLPLTVCRVAADTRWLICEYSARGTGHITALCDIARPSFAAVLNVGQAHVGEFGSIEAVAAAKAELVEALPPTGTAVLNLDDPRVAAMTAQTDARVVSYGVGNGADVQIRDLVLDADGRPSFALSTPEVELRLRLRLVGEHHAYNAAAAAALALAAGLPPELIGAALEAAEPVSRHRMEVRHRAGGGITIDDAYNANPQSMLAGLRAAAQLAVPAGARRWAALGAMRELGPEASALHESVGAAAASLGFDRVIAVGPDAKPIATGAETVSEWHGHADVVEDRHAAMGLLAAELGPSDLVLIKASNAEQLWLLADQLQVVSR